MVTAQEVEEIAEKIRLIAPEITFLLIECKNEEDLIRMETVVHKMIGLVKGETQVGAKFVRAISENDN